MADSGKPPGRRYLEAMLAGRVAPPPFAALLKMRLTEVGDGTAHFEMPLSDELYNPNDVVHGGAITALVDSAMGLAVVSTLGEGETFTTVELKVNFLRAVTTDLGPLHCDGRVIQRGRQVVVAEADCLDAHGRRCARAISTNLVLQPRASAAWDVDEASAPSAAPPIAAAIPAPVEAPVPATPAAIAPSSFARGKQHLRLLAGDMAYVRRGQGPPVVLIHGIPSSAYLWRDVVDPLARRFDVIAVDLYGFGDSEKRLDADLSIAAQARYVVALLEALHIYQAALVGHDIGGGIAQLIAVDEPARVARLCLIDSIVDNNWPVADIARLKDPAWDQIMKTLDLRRGFRKGLESGLVVPGRMQDEILDEWVRPFSDQGGRRSYLRAARALNNRDLVSRSRHIEQIAAPTLILWGAQDRYLDPAWGPHLQRKIHGSRLQVIDPGGHFLPLDRPDAVAQALLEFLA
ncbi:MAG TPA: alpha/beta fold hydrolase [Candidatus Limnocylindrales bacterium]|nr:alpha/beta fold hydrolase [Candidatus Limnocylindrales bacterium]